MFISVSDMPQAEVVITDGRIAEVVAMVLYTYESDEAKDIVSPSGNGRGVWDIWSISLAIL